MLLLDATTLLAAATIALAFMATAQLTTWAFERRQPAPLWTALATALCCISAVLRELLPQSLAIILANVILGFGLSCIATACRVLGGRKVSGVGLLLPAGAWFVACGQPAFMASQTMRSTASSFSCAAVMAWALSELWRNRHEKLWSRFGLMALLGIQGVAALARAYACLTTSSQQEGVARTADVIRTTFWSFGSLLLIGFGIIFFMRERSEQQLRSAASEDPLTKLANRRAFNGKLDVAFEAAVRSQRSLSILMIDADTFKAYNDLYGHPAGDRALQAIAAVLSSSVDLDAVAARYGGEEFAVLLPETDAVAAYQIATTIGSEIRRLGIEHGGSPHGYVTVSIGLATTTPSIGAQIADLVLVADQALYTAKRAGRNCVHSASLLKGDHHFVAELT